MLMLQNVTKLWNLSAYHRKGEIFIGDFLSVLRSWELKSPAQTAVHLILHQPQVNVWICKVFKCFLVSFEHNTGCFYVVHEVRPADLKVVAAVGDSLTVSDVPC